MKKALSGLLTFAMILSITTACNRSTSDSNGESSQIASSITSEPAIETEPPEPTKGELLFRKDTEKEPGSFRRVKLDHSLEELGTYSAYGNTAVPLENSFLCSCVIDKEITPEDYECMGFYVMEYDYEGNRLDYHKLDEIDSEQAAYFLTDQNRILLITYELTYSSDETCLVYEYDPQQHALTLLFEITIPYFGEMKFDAFVDGKLYKWLGDEEAPENCVYQRYDLEGNLECETEIIDFTSDTYHYTEYYSYGGQSEQYGISKYFCQGFWREDTYYVLRSAEGEATFDVLCFDKELNKIDEFQTDIDSMKLFCRGEQRNEYVADQDGIYSWNTNEADWERILSWDQTSLDWDAKKVSSYCQVLLNDRILYDEDLLLPGDPLDDPEDEITIVTIAATSFSGAVYYADDEIWSRKQYYYDYCIDDYGKIHGCSRLEPIIKDFREGRLDVLLINDLYMLGGPILAAQDSMRLADQIVNEGDCLDLSPYVQPYLDGQKRAFFHTPISLIPLFERTGKQYVFPVVDLRMAVDTLFSNGSIPLGAESTYSDWIEYARSLGSGKKLLFYGKEAFLRQCLSYDIDSFIDGETGTARFDCQEFKDLLLLCKEYCDQEGGMKKGTDPFEDAQITSANAISSTGQTSNVQRIGFPSAHGTGYCLIPCSYFVISASCTHPDEAWKVVEGCLEINERNSNDRIWAYSFSATDSWGFVGEDWTFDNDVRLSDIALTYFPDQELIDLIVEEAKKYFYGDVSLEDTVREINEKVQNVLDRRE
ncbi:MAG: hypothetical protein IK020_10670 [Clostridiales bacterium]|nr:hypothetical protein [Clostridiales bacterium]